MKAMVMPRPGAAEVLELREVDTPRIKRPTELLIKLMAAGVNPLDTKLRSRSTYYPDRMPAVLGCDGAGVVAAVGGGVSRYKVGDEVYFCNGGIGGEQGNYAEYTLIEERFTARKPASLSFIEAAAVPLALITAHESLFDRIDLQRGQRILVHAGGGGVGHLAVQLACNAGARVATTVGSDEKARFVTGLGAELAIRYRQQDFAAACREWTGGDGVDAAFDTVGGRVFTATFSAVRYYGHVVTLLEPDTGIGWKEARLRNLTVGYELMLTPMLYNLGERREHQANILDGAAASFDNGSLRVHATQVFPLEEAAAAHREIERGSTMGKIVLAVSEDR